MGKKFFLVLIALAILLIMYLFACSAIGKQRRVFFYIGTVNNNKLVATFKCPSDDDTGRQFLFKVTTTNKLNENITGSIKVFKDNMLIETRDVIMLKPNNFIIAKNEINSNKFLIEKNPNNQETLYSIVCTSAVCKISGSFWHNVFEPNQEFTVELNCDQTLPENTHLGLMYFYIKYWWKSW